MSNLERLRQKMTPITAEVIPLYEAPSYGECMAFINGSGLVKHSYIVDELNNDGTVEPTKTGEVALVHPEDPVWDYQDGVPSQPE